MRTSILLKVHALPTSQDAGHNILRKALKSPQVSQQLQEEPIACFLSSARGEPQMPTGCYVITAQCTLHTVMGIWKFLLVLENSYQPFSLL